MDLEVQRGCEANGAQDTHPQGEALRRDFPVRIEAAIDERVRGQSERVACGRIAHDARGVGRLVGARQHGDLLVVVRALLRGDHVRVGDQIVVPRRAERARIGEPVDLDRRGTLREDARQRRHAVAVDVDQDVDARFADFLRDRGG